MKQRFFPSLACTLSFFLFSLTLMAQGTLAPREDKSKILAGYFEEWSIYGANYNVANLQQNHVADRITHVFYAFGNVAPVSGPPDATCHLADDWADYQTPYLPSVNGFPYTGPLYGNFALYCS
jgi:chitinase